MTELSEPRWLGLIDPDGHEVNYHGYHRQPIFPGDWEVIYPDGMLLAVQNILQIGFPGDPGGGVDASAVGMWATQQDGIPLKSWEMRVTRRLDEAGAWFTPGAFVIHLDQLPPDPDSPT